jgi:hypothetical protein
MRGNFSTRCLVDETIPPGHARLESSVCNQIHEAMFSLLKDHLEGRDGERFVLCFGFVCFVLKPLLLLDRMVLEQKSATRAPVQCVERCEV